VGYLSDLIHKLRSELNDFWEWTGITSKDYNETHLEGDNYPEWLKLKGLVYQAIRQLRDGHKNEELIELILEFMALDNEAEYTLDVCQNELSEEELIYLIEGSIKFPLSDARWQIAELVGRKNDIN
jgi:hypothetical protein